MPDEFQPSRRVSAAGAISGSDLAQTPAGQVRAYEERLGEAQIDSHDRAAERAWA